MATRRDSPIRPSVRFSPKDSHFPPRAMSRSPDRSAAPKYHTIDPLLSNLSPESTLLALTSTDAIPKNEKAAHDILWKSISEVSPSERALGIRAAIAAQKLGEWYKELQAWNWPKRSDVHLGKGFIPPSPSTNTAKQQEQGYFGSLPSAVVIQHEARVEEIRDGMDSLDVEELKEHVLSAHIPARSRPSSSNSTMSVPPPLSYVQLSDFTAVITATILRALPLLSRLSSLLSTWDVRLLVLRQIPGLLHALQLARSELDSAQDALRSTVPPSEHDALYSRENYHAKRAGLEAMVLSAGRRMDLILDALDGREDSLPEAWIDDLENIESDFSTWVMEAEKCTVENEWLRLKAIKSKTDESRREQIPPSRLSNIPEEEDARSSVSVPSKAVLQSEAPPSLEVIEEGESDDLDSPSDLVLHDHTSLGAVDTQNVTEALPANAPGEAVNESSAVSDVPEELSGPSISDSEARPSITGPDEHNNLHAECKQISSSEVESVLPENSVDPTSNATTSLISNAMVPDIYSESASHQQLTDPASSETTTEDEDNSPCVPSIATPPSTILDPQLPSRPSELDLPAAQLSSPIADNTASGDKAAPMRLQTDLPSCKDLAADSTPTARIFDMEVSIPIEDEAETLPSLTAGAATTEVPVSRVSTSIRSSTPLPEPAEPADSPFSSSSPPPQKEAAVISSSDQPKDSDSSIPRKTRLESPIKLSKTRPQTLDLGTGSPNVRGRRASTASVGSLSDYPSLISSPEMREPRTASSNETPLALETPPFYQGIPRPPGNVSPGLGYTLREERLKHLNGQKGSNATSAHNRTLSLPLQRFINERFEMQYESSGGADLNTSLAGRRASDASVDLRAQIEHQAPKSQLRISSTPINNLKNLAGPHLELSDGKKPTLESDEAIPRLSKAWEHTKDTAFKSPTQPKAISERVIAPKAADSRKRLAAHPNLESSRALKPKSRLRGDSIASKEGSRSSIPSKQLRKPKKDQLDEKINSILTSIPAQIQLVSPEDHDADESTAVAPSLPLKQKERFRSMTPQGPSSRSSTPPPSLTLRAAPSRRRNSQAPEESSVKLYHLHRGKAAPTKLFIRTVGENSDRVMVRVGGGWADLAEYLREYAIHHGCRTVSETPRVEIQGISSRHSPARSSPGDMSTPTGNSGRRTPSSRPASVISNRPSSSLAVRKIRRVSNVSDAPDFRSFSAGHALAASYSPLSAVSSRRRLSVCSSASFGGASLASDMHHGSFTNSPSMPLGLAGPTPRSRRVTISPESEAWVEDVLGQARRTSSLRPVRYFLPPHELEQDGTAAAAPTAPTLSKSRSINDLGQAGSSRRVALRGFGAKS